MVTISAVSDTCLACSAAPLPVERITAAAPWSMSLRMIDGVLVGLLSSFSTTRRTGIPLIPPSSLMRSIVARTVVPAMVEYEAPGPVESSSIPITM